MGCWARIIESAQSYAVPSTKLSAKMFPFKRQLAAGDCDHRCYSPLRDLASIKPIAPRNGLIMDAPQVRADSANRISTLAEARELGVVAVPLCLVQQYLLGQQCLAPQGNNASAVQVTRM
jgi:hypothetical protein